MNKSFKKLLSLVLAIVMAVGVMSGGMLVSSADTEKIALDSCDSRDNWGWNGDMGDSPNGGREVWWEIHNYVFFSEAKDLTGLESVVINMSKGPDHNNNNESVDYADLLRDKNGKIVLSSYPTSLGNGANGDLFHEDTLRNHEAFTTYGCAVSADALKQDLVDGDNTFAIDLSTAGASFDITKVTGIIFDLEGTNHDLYFDDISAIVSTGSATEPSEATLAVIEAIKALPSASRVSYGDAEAVNAARSAYDALPAAQKALVTNYSRLVSIEKALNDSYYISKASWSVEDFKAAATSGDGLLTSDTSLYKAFRSSQVLGTRASGIVGYMSCGKTFLATEGHIYQYEIELDVEDILEKDINDNMLFCDMYNQSAEGAGFKTTYFSEGLKKADFDAAGDYQYDTDYGYRYKVVTQTITAKEGGTVEPRLYYNHIWDNSEEESVSYGVGILRAYRYKIYDMGTAEAPADKNLVLDIRCGREDFASSEGWGINPGYEDTADLISTIETGKAIMVSKPAAAGLNNALLMGNMGAELEAGSYRFNYKLSNIIADEGDILTVKIMNGENEVTSKTFTDKDVAADGSLDIDLPFTADAKGTYTTGIYINDKASLSLNTVDLSARLNLDYVNDFEAKVAAIGEFDTPTDDVKAKIEAAEAALEVIHNNYDDAIDSKLTSYKTLTDARKKFDDLVNKEKVMNEAAETVAKLIEAIPSEITADAACGDAIKAAADARDDFIDKYGEDKLKELVAEEKLAALTSASEKYNELINKLGDMNGNGKVDVNDALSVLQIAVGKVNPTDAQKAMADVDKSGKVDVNDALQVLQMAVGKITEYKVASK